MEGVGASRTFRSLRSAGADIDQRRGISRTSLRMSGSMIAVVDAGPLYAAVDADDDDHLRCLEVLQRVDLDLVVPALVVAEVTYLVGRRLGAEVESGFLRGLGTLEVEAPIADDWPAIAELVAALCGTSRSAAPMRRLLSSPTGSGPTSSSRSIDAISERSVRRTVAPTGSFRTKAQSATLPYQAWRSRHRWLQRGHR